jgi:hypothetical protein
MKVDESTEYENCIGVKDTTQAITFEELLGDVTLNLPGTVDWKKHWKGTV